MHSVHCDCHSNRRGGPSTLYLSTDSVVWFLCVLFCNEAGMILKMFELELV